MKRLETTLITHTWCDEELISMHREDTETATEPDSNVAALYRELFNRRGPTAGNAESICDGRLAEHRYFRVLPWTWWVVRLCVLA